MAGAVLAGCGATQRRLRKLPARVVVYLLLAAALSGECGYLAVWARLTAALGPLHLPQITATALWHARAQLLIQQSTQPPPESPKSKTSWWRR